jgi:hypothetical protein
VLSCSESVKARDACHILLWFALYLFALYLHRTELNKLGIREPHRCSHAVNCISFALKQKITRGARPTPRSHWLLDELLVVGETRPTTLLFADPPTALAVTAEGASCVARAVPSGSVSCMLAARRVPTDRFADGVPGAGREPSAAVLGKASNPFAASRATSLQRADNVV